MTRLVLLACTLFALTAGTGLTQERAPELYQSDQGKFRVAFPERPKIDTKDLATGKAGAAVVSVVTERAEAPNRAILAVIYADYPDEFKTVPAKKLLDAARDGLKGKDGKLRMEKEVTLKNSPASSYRDLRIEAGSNVIRVRLYLVGTRLYQVMVTGDRKTTTNTVCDTFLDSFELIP